jgi:hypothetical protein
MELSTAVTEGKGVQILDVKRGDRRDGAPAFNAGLEADIDYVIRVMDNKPLKSDREFGLQMKERTPGDLITMDVYSDRTHSTRQITVEVGAVGLSPADVRDLRVRCQLTPADLEYHEGKSQVFKRPKDWLRLPECYLHPSQFQDLMSLRKELKDTKEKLKKAEFEAQPGCLCGSTHYCADGVAIERLLEATGELKGGCRPSRESLQLAKDSVQKSRSLRPMSSRVESFAGPKYSIQEGYGEDDDDPDAPSHISPRPGPHTADANISVTRPGIHHVHENDPDASTSGDSGSSKWGAVRAGVGSGRLASDQGDLSRTKSEAAPLKKALSIFGSKPTSLTPQDAVTRDPTKLECRGWLQKEGGTALMKKWEYAPPFVSPFPFPLSHSCGSKVCVECWQAPLLRCHEGQWPLVLLQEAGGCQAGRSPLAAVHGLQLLQVGCVLSHLTLLQAQSSCKAPSQLRPLGDRVRSSCSL